MARATTKAVEDDAKKKAEAENDIYDDEYKKVLRLECRKHRDVLIPNEVKMTQMHNDERLKINYFWLISKKELEDK
jgi:hypothetical protein